MNFRPYKAYKEEWYVNVIQDRTRIIRSNCSRAGQDDEITYAKWLLRWETVEKSRISWSPQQIVNNEIVHATIL